MPFKSPSRPCGPHQRAVLAVWPRIPTPLFPVFSSAFLLRQLPRHWGDPSKACLSPPVLMSISFPWDNALTSLSTHFLHNVSLCLLKQSALRSCCPVPTTWGSTEMLFSSLSGALAAELKRQLPYNHLEGTFWHRQGHNWPHQPGWGGEAAFGYLGKAAAPPNSIIQANGCDRMSFSAVKFLSVGCFHD